MTTGMYITTAICATLLAITIITTFGGKKK